MRLTLVGKDPTLTQPGPRRTHGAVYERVSLFRIYEHNVIPGLLQTAAYCSAMLSFWIDFLDVPDDLDAAVAARMERQRVLHQAGKRFAVVLEEQALRTWFGTAEVQAGQLGRLLQVMSIPTVSLGIIPMMTARSAVPSAGFCIFDDSLVALETPTASIDVTRPQEIELYARRLTIAASRDRHLRGDGDGPFRAMMLSSVCCGAGWNACCHHARHATIS